MVGIILATHGNFATGIQQSASMIFGEQPNVAAVTLQPNEGPDYVRKKMEEAVASFEDPQQVLIYGVELHLIRQMVLLQVMRIHGQLLPVLTCRCLLTLMLPV